VLNQDFQDWELLLVDDGSTDGGLETLPRPLDPRIRVISDGKNMGLVARLNQIAQLARAAYLARMDADDIMHPQRLIKQLEHLVGHPELDLVASGAWVIDDDNRVYAKRYNYPLPTDPRSVLRQDFILHPTVTARTDWFLAHPYDQAYLRGEDKELWCRTRHVSRFARLTDPLLFFRAGSDVKVAGYRIGCRTDRKILKRYAPQLVGPTRARAMLALSWAKETITVSADRAGIGSIAIRLRSTRVSEAERVGAQAVLNEVLARCAEPSVLDDYRLPAAKVHGIHVELADDDTSLADELRAGGAAGAPDDHRALSDRGVGPAGIGSVVQVSSYYPPHLGGAETVMEQLSAALYRRGIDVSVVSSRLPRTAPRVETNGVPVRRLAAREIAHTPLIPLLPIVLGRRARGALFHVHVGQAFVPETVALVSRVFRRPYVAHVHLIVRPTGALGGLLPIYNRMVLRAVLHGAKKVVCLTEVMRAEIINTYALAADSVVVIPNGISAEWFVQPEAVLPAEGEPIGGPVSAHVVPHGEILFVGRLTAQKNLPVLISAMALLPDYNLRIVGDGVDEPALRAQVDVLGLHNVAFAGRLPREGIQAAMSQSHLLAMPSTHEGMPLVLLEAFAAGLPAIVSDIPELRQYAGAARLVASDDPTAWADGIRQLMADDEARSALAGAGRAIAAAHAWDRVIALWVDLYTSVQRRRTAG
jgi:glycosyltransferase involved in cell wall biosynthesis